MRVIYLLGKNKAFKERIDKCFSTKFDGTTSARISKTIKHDITRAIDMIMLYKNRKPLVFKVLGIVVYCFNEKYVCVDYLCLQREAKFSLKFFDKTHSFTSKFLKII